MRLSELLEDEGVRRWFLNLSKGSVLTARVMAARLGRFWDLTGVGPHDLLRMGSREIEDLLIEWFDEFERMGFGPSYILEFKKAIRSWLSFNDVEFNDKKVKVRSPSRSFVERVPSSEELRRLIVSAPLKTKVMIVLMAYSFLRPESLGNWNGSDGLLIEDFPEMEVKDGKVGFRRVPTMVIVRPSLSKARHQYFTFLSEEGCEYLKDYLETRIRGGEDVSGRTPLFPGEDGFMNTDSITKAIRRAMRRLGFNWRPYVLRAYGATQLDIAEAKGLISHPWRQFFMGHKGDIEARYSTNKGFLPPDMIEEMRNSYRKCQQYIEAVKQSVKEDPELTSIKTMVEAGVLDLTKPAVRNYLLQKLGIEDMQVKIAKTKQPAKSEDDTIIDLICESLGINPINVRMSKPKTDPKIVKEEELEKYLLEGWNIKTVLPSGRILITREQ
ncbi:MAG: site-specific integrase [Nitrososphaeria archaeon]